MVTPLIEFKNVTKRFGSRTVLEHVNLQIYEGEVTTIIGLSGAGKSVLIAVLGHEAAQEAIRCMGTYIDKHFGVMGGFSSRRHFNEFVTMLPYSDEAEARGILLDFADDFRKQGIHDIWTGARKQTASAQCIEFSILAGLAQGQPISEMDTVIDSARQKQKEIARLRCDL